LCKLCAEGTINGKDRRSLASQKSGAGGGANSAQLCARQCQATYLVRPPLQKCFILLEKRWKLQHDLHRVDRDIWQKSTAAVSGFSLLCTPSGSLSCDSSEARSPLKRPAATHAPALPERLCLANPTPGSEPVMVCYNYISNLTCVH